MTTRPPDPLMPPETPQGRTPRRPRAVRLRTAMLLIVGVAFWLALYRAAPELTVLVTAICLPTMALHRGFVWMVGRIEGQAPGPVFRSYLLFTALTITLIGVALFSFVIYFR